MYINILVTSRVDFSGEIKISNFKGEVFIYNLIRLKEKIVYQTFQVEFTWWPNFCWDIFKVARDLYN